MDNFLRKKLTERGYVAHASSILQYHRCRRKWALHQLFEPETEHKALTFGTAFHRVMELATSEGLSKLPSELVRSEGFELEDEEYKLLDNMYNYYLRWVAADENSYYRNLTVLETELKFSIGGLEGRLDAVVRDEFDQYWVLDYKTRSQLQGEAAFDTDLQMTAYAWAAQQLDWPVEGVIVVQFLKKAAKGLRTLKNGSYSKAKNQVVSPLIVRKQLEDLDSNELDEYAEFAFYDPDKDPYIRAVKTYRNKTNLERFGRYLKQHYKEVALILDRYTDFLPNFTRDCTWDCPFRAVCMACEDGFDWQEILEGNFKEREVSND